MLFEPKVCFDLRTRAGFISFASLGWLGLHTEQPPGGAKTGKAVDPGARGEGVEAARDQRPSRGSCERCKEHQTGGKPGGARGAHAAPESARPRGSSAGEKTRDMTRHEVIRDRQVGLESCEVASCVPVLPCLLPLESENIHSTRK